MDYNHAPFLWCPNEIMNKIISLIVHQLNPKEKHWLPLCLVCKRLLALTQPFLYKDLAITIEFDLSSPHPLLQPEQKSAMLIRSLQHNVALGEHVQALCLSLEKGHALNPHEFFEMDIASVFASDAWKQLIRLLKCFPAIRSLSIWEKLKDSGGIAFYLLHLAAQAMRSVRKVYLSVDSTVSNTTLLQCLQSFLNLKELNLRCGSPFVVSSGNPGFQLGKMESIGSRNPLEHLEILHITGEMEYSDLFAECKNLKELYWQGVSCGPKCHIRPFSDMQTTLGLIEHSLQKLVLRIPDYGYEEREYLDLSKFNLRGLSYLRTLNLSDWMFHIHNKPVDLYYAFLAGSIRSIDWMCQLANTRSLSVDQIVFVRDTFRIAHERGSCIQDFKFAFWLPHRGDRQFATDCKKALSELQLELSQRGIKADCRVKYVQLEQYIALLPYYSEENAPRVIFPEYQQD